MGTHIYVMNFLKAYLFIYWSKSNINFISVILVTVAFWFIPILASLENWKTCIINWCRKNYFKEGDYLYPKFDAVEAYRRALKTWGKWIDDNIKPSKQLVFYRGYSSAHFRYTNMLFILLQRQRALNIFCPLHSDIEMRARTECLFYILPCLKIGEIAKINLNILKLSRAVFMHVISAITSLLKDQSIRNSKKLRTLNFSY